MSPWRPFFVLAIAAAIGALANGVFRVISHESGESSWAGSLWFASALIWLGTAAIAHRRERRARSDLVDRPRD